MIDQKQILQILNQSGVEITPTDDDFGKPFKAIGIDSLDVFNFLSEIEMVLGKSFSEEEFASVESLSDVLELLNK